MSALTIDLLGHLPLTEAEIQARAQDIIASVWPVWMRERAMRLAAGGSGEQLAALNGYLAGIGAVVDQARADSALLREALAYEAAQVRLARPAYDGPALLPGDEGTFYPAPDSERDAAERQAAQTVLDTASAEVLALVSARMPAPPAADDQEVSHDPV